MMQKLLAESSDPSDDLRANKESSKDTVGKPEELVSQEMIIQNDRNGDSLYSS